jgi:hypothetical protein
MPLSEHEQRLLEEMERSLYQNDADFVAKVGGHHGRPAYRSVVLGVLVVVLGIAALITGVFIQWIIVGIVGFVLMFVGVLLAIAPARGGSARRKGAPGTPGAARPAGQPGFMDRLNERWDKRQHGE